MKKIILILFLMTTKLSFGQINNGDFEVWDTIYTNTYSSELSDTFGVPDPKGGVINSWTYDDEFGISRTTDSYSGNYSLILHNWYNYIFQRISYKDTLSYRPQYLQGYFKYITGGVDSLSLGTMNVALTRFNGSSNDTIATGTYQFDSTAAFTLFQLPLNYVSTSMPDSIDIFIINANSPCTYNMVCNLLYLDSLTLTNTPMGTGTKKLNLSGDIITFYPNPAYKELSIQNNSTQTIQFTLYNSLGEIIISRSLTKETSKINLSAYANGFYFYKLASEKNNLIKTGKIIKQ